MSKKIDPDMYPVINTEARIHQIAQYDKGEDYDNTSPHARLAPKNTTVVKLSPGLNYVAADLLVAAGFADSNHQGRLRVQSPAELPEYEAVELASYSSRPALRQWRSTEERPAVQAAIDKALAG